MRYVSFFKQKFHMQPWLLAFGGYGIIFIFLYIFFFIKPNRKYSQTLTAADAATNISYVVIIFDMDFMRKRNVVLCELNLIKNEATVNINIDLPTGIVTSHSCKGLLVKSVPGEYFMSRLFSPNPPLYPYISSYPHQNMNVG